MRSKRTHPGIRVRHARACPSSSGGSCRCEPSYEAWVFSAREGKKIRRTFPTLAAAKGWRADATVALQKGTLRSPSKLTLREAGEAWLKGAKGGQIRTRSGDRYKPSALRGYEAALRGRVLPDLGGAKLSAIQRADVQDLADRLLASGLDPSTIRNTLMPLRAIYRRALARGEVAVNPTTGLELPAVRGRRDRVASADEAAKLLAALPEADRALWATAFYAGLRRGELLALRWEDVDLAAGVIRVERAWDVKVGVVEPKSRAGRRSVPIAAALRDYLLEHKLRSRRSEGLVFGRSGEIPFEPVSLRARTLSAWRAAGLESISLHEARHSFASLMIAAGVNGKALSSYLGHSSIAITLDRYGHLMPGNEGEAAALLDAYLVRADTRARFAQVTT
jgi:integrase